METIEKKATILIIEDLPENIDILFNVLKNTYEIKVATNGKNALQIIKKELPDLILLDIVMPEMDGYETIHELKSNPATKNIPVIFLSGMSAMQDIVKGFELGAVDYITKPFSPPIVLARVKIQLDLKFAQEKLENQNIELLEMAKIKEDVEHMTRHDLKSPLTTIIGNTELLPLLGEMNDKQLKHMKMIKNAGIRMISMINRSLDLVKMERGIYKLEAEPVNILEIITSIIEERSDILSKRDLSIKIHTNNGKPNNEKLICIQGEKLLFYSLFSNLIDNAIEASPNENQITISMNYNQDLEISIHNKGEVPAEIRDKFFEKFVSFGKRKGTGLGTYSAKLLTETMGGKIEMQSSAQNGTIISLNFSK